MLIPRGKLIQDNLAKSYVLLEPLVDDLREGGFSGLVEIVLRQTNAFIVFDGGNVAAFLEERGNDCARVTLDELAAKSRNERGRVLIYAYPPLTASLIAARVNAHSLYDAVSGAVADPARLIEKLAREPDREWFVEVHRSNGTSSLVFVGEGLCCVIDSTVESDAEPFDSTNLGESQKLNELLAECQSFGATLSVSFLRVDEAARPLYVEVKPHIAPTPDDSSLKTSDLAEVDIPILDASSPQISEELFSQEVEQPESYLDLPSAESPERDAQGAISELSRTRDPAGVDDFDFDQIQPSGSSDWIDESTLETVEDQSTFEGYQIDAMDWGSMPEASEQPEGEAVHHQTGEAAEAVTAAEVQSQASTREVDSPAASPEASMPKAVNSEASIPEATSSEAPTLEAPILEAADSEAPIPETASPEAASQEAASTEAKSAEVPSLEVPTPQAVSTASLENNFEAHDSVEAVISESAELTLEPKLESESGDNRLASIPAFLIEPDDSAEVGFDETDISDEIVGLDDYPEPIVEPPDSDAGVEIASPAVVTTDDRIQAESQLIEAQSQLIGAQEPAISGEAGEISVSDAGENVSIADAGSDVDQSEPVLSREPLASLADDIRQLTAAELTAPDIPLDAEIADELSDVKRLMAEICRTIDEAAQGVGKPDNFSMSLRAGQIKVADDYPFLDPFAGEFEYLAGEIVFVGQATADKFIEGLSQALMFAVERVMKTTSYPERFRAYLAEDLRKIAVRNESEFERFGLDGVINRLLDGERASATGS